VLQSYKGSSHRTCDPGALVYGSEILEDYYRVEVLTVVQGYEDDMLDIHGPEGIEKLGQAIKNFIL